MKCQAYVYAVVFGDIFIYVKVSNVVENSEIPAVLSGSNGRQTDKYSSTNTIMVATTDIPKTNSNLRQYCTTVATNTRMYTGSRRPH